MNKERHSKVTFCDLEKASKSINDPFFIDLEEFDDETFEVILIQFKFNVNDMLIPLCRRPGFEFSSVRS